MRAAFFAARERLAFVRRRAAVRACRDNALREADRRGSRFSAFLTARERRRDGLRRDPAFRESRAACFFILADPSLAAETLLRLVVPWIIRWRWLAAEIVRRAFPREYAPSLPVQIRLLGSMAIFLRAHLPEPVRLFLVLA